MKEKKGFNFKKIPALKAFKRYSAYVYLGAAVVTVAVMAVSIYSINRGDEVSLPEISVPSIQLPEISDTPVVNNPADIPADIIPVTEYYLPVSGETVTPHSVTELVFSPTMQDYRIHLGVDITTEQGAPVCAVADGSVKQIWEDPLMGFCVALSHAGDCTTVYKNLAKEMAEGLTVGKAVKQGELLGYVGESAMLELAQEPHLHLEMTVGDLQVDPLDYFSATVLATLTEDTAYEGTLGK